MSDEVWHFAPPDARFSERERVLAAAPDVATLAHAAIAFGEQAPAATHLRLAVAAAPLEPWAVAAALAGQHDERPHFGHGADDGLRWAAGGAVMRFELDADHPAACAEAHAAAARASLGVLAAEQATLLPAAPWALVALAYAAPAPHQHDDWGALGGGMLVVPAWIVARTQAGSCCIVQAAMPPRKSDVQRWARQLIARLHRLVALGAAHPRLHKPQARLHAPAPLQHTNRPAWLARVRQACAALGPRDAAAPALRKVVLAERFVVPLAQKMRVECSAALDVLTALHDEGAGLNAFLLPLGPDAWFVGATPEVLVRVRDGALMTHAVAGTCAITNDGSAVSARLLDDDKERREHAVVVAGLLQKLAAHCDGPLQLGPTAPRSFGQLMHLVTPVQGQLRPGAALLALARLLHPTAALGGHPQAQALAYLRHNEPFVRGLYGAPLGYLTPSGDGVLYVGIRSAQLMPGCAVLFAGAGIVDGSDPAREWDELQLKLAPMRRALAAAAP